MALSAYERPLHRSLTEPILLAGVPRSLAILNGTLMAALVFGLHSWLGLPLGGIVHLVAAAATKYDPQWLDVLRRHLWLPGYWQAG